MSEPILTAALEVKRTEFRPKVWSFAKNIQLFVARIYDSEPTSRTIANSLVINFENSVSGAINVNQPLSAGVGIGLEPARLMVSVTEYWPRIYLLT